MSPLGGVLVYLHTRMLTYSPWRITRLIVAGIFLLGEYTFTRRLDCSYTRSWELLVIRKFFPWTIARLLVCSFARLLADWFARDWHLSDWHLSLEGLLLLLVSLLRSFQPPGDYVWRALCPL
jgi:hypothetical protein